MKLSLCPFCGWIPGRQFGRVWSSKIFNGFDILLVVLGESMKWKEEEFYGRAMAELPRLIFRA